MKEYTKKDTVELVKTVREKLSISRDILSSLLGVHVTTVYRWEMGTRYPNNWQIMMMDAFLDSAKNTEKRIGMKSIDIPRMTKFEGIPRTLCFLLRGM